jgi:hypothetical protein
MKTVKSRLFLARTPITCHAQFICVGQCVHHHPPCVMWTRNKEMPTFYKVYRVIMSGLVSTDKKSGCTKAPTQRKGGTSNRLWSGGVRHALCTNDRERHHLNGCGDYRMWGRRACNQTSAGRRPTTIIIKHEHNHVIICATCTRGRNRFAPAATWRHLYLHPPAATAVPSHPRPWILIVRHINTASYFQKLRRVL